jgi:hypothetical protein
MYELCHLAYLSRVDDYISHMNRTRLFMFLKKCDSPVHCETGKAVWWKDCPILFQIIKPTWVARFSLWSGRPPSRAPRFDVISDYPGCDDKSLSTGSKPELARPCLNHRCLKRNSKSHIELLCLWFYHQKGISWINILSWLVPEHVLISRYSRTEKIFYHWFFSSRGGISVWICPESEMIVEFDWTGFVRALEERLLSIDLGGSDRLDGDTSIFKIDELRLFDCFSFDLFYDSRIAYIEAQSAFRMFFKSIKDSGCSVRNM